MSTSRVLSEDPELAEAIPLPLRARAVEECVAPVRSVGRGRWRPESGAAGWVGPGGIGLLVMEGLLAAAGRGR